MNIVAYSDIGHIAVIVARCTIAAERANAATGLGTLLFVSLVTRRSRHELGTVHVVTLDRRRYNLPCERTGVFDARVYREYAHIPCRLLIGMLASVSQPS